MELTQDEIDRRRAILGPHDGTNERAFLGLMSLLFCWQGMPRTYIDFGSGTGAMVNMARKMGAEAYGIDLIARGPGRESWFIQHDLTEFIQLIRMAGHDIEYAVGEDAKRIDWEKTSDRPVRAQLVTCLEVAEHLPESSADVLCDSIAAVMERYSLLVFSAAPPGQAGDDHVNCQPATYWRAKFHARGISYREDYTRQLAHLWAWVSGPLWWLGSNVQVFDK